MHNFVKAAGFGADGNHTGIDAGENSRFQKGVGEILSVIDRFPADVQFFAEFLIIGKLCGKVQAFFRIHAAA